MNITQTKDARKSAFHALNPGDLVRVVRVGYGYAGPGTGELLATAVVVKVLSKTIRVAWSEEGKQATDFSRDSGKKAGERRWINYPVLDVVGAPAVGPACQ